MHGHEDTFRVVRLLQRQDGGNIMTKCSDTHPPQGGTAISPVPAFFSLLFIFAKYTGHGNGNKSRVFAPFRLITLKIETFEWKPHYWHHSPPATGCKPTARALNLANQVKIEEQVTCRQLTSAPSVDNSNDSSICIIFFTVCFI